MIIKKWILHAETMKNSWKQHSYRNRSTILHPAPSLIVRYLSIVLKKLWSRKSSGLEKLWREAHDNISKLNQSQFCTKPFGMFISRSCTFAHNASQVPRTEFHSSARTRLRCPSCTKLQLIIVRFVRARDYWAVTRHGARSPGLRQTSSRSSKGSSWRWPRWFWSFRKKEASAEPLVLRIDRYCVFFWINEGSALEPVSKGAPRPSCNEELAPHLWALPPVQQGFLNLHCAISCAYWKHIMRNA